MRNLINLPEKYNEIQICHEFENILNQEGFGGEMKLAFNKLPLFLTTNLEAINKRILINNGSLEIISGNFSILSSLPIDLKGNIKLYGSSRKIKREFSVFYGDKIITLSNKGNFILYKKNYTYERYLKIFEEILKSDNIYGKNHPAILEKQTLCSNGSVR